MRCSQGFGQPALPAGRRLLLSAVYYTKFEGLGTPWWLGGVNTLLRCSCSHHAVLKHPGWCSMYSCAGVGCCFCFLPQGIVAAHSLLAGVAWCGASVVSLEGLDPTPCLQHPASPVPVCRYWLGAQVQLVIAMLHPLIPSPCGSRVAQLERDCSACLAA